MWNLPLSYQSGSTGAGTDAFPETDACSEYSCIFVYRYGSRSDPADSQPCRVCTGAAYGRPERIALWKGFTEEHGIRKQVDCITAGSKFKLSAEEIRKAVERIVVTSAALTIGESEIGRICEEVLLKPSCGSIKRIPVQYTFDDLKLWPEQKRILNNICAHVWHRHKVYDEWNLESRYSYGKNVSALFYGPPGTGKTMAVHVIANMLNLPLYRIDLSQVVDKIHW